MAAVDVAADVAVDADGEHADYGVAVGCDVD